MSHDRVMRLLIDVVEFAVIVVCLSVWVWYASRRYRRAKKYAAITATEPYVVGICSARSFTFAVLERLLEGKPRADGRVISIARVTPGRHYGVVFVDMDEPCEIQTDIDADREIGITTSHSDSSSKGRVDQVINLTNTGAIEMSVGAIGRYDLSVVPLPLLILACLMAGLFIALIVFGFVKGL